MGDVSADGGVVAGDDIGRRGAVVEDQWDLRGDGVSGEPADEGDRDSDCARRDLWLRRRRV